MSLVNDYTAARASKDWARADAIRASLVAQGYAVRVWRDGSVVVTPIRRCSAGAQVPAYPSDPHAGIPRRSSMPVVCANGLVFHDTTCACEKCRALQSANPA